MKKIFLSIIVFISSMFYASAQEVYSSADTIWITGPNKANDSDFSDLEKDFIFKNINAASDSFRWVRSVNNLPSNDWESAVCDINLCYPTNVDSADFEMKSGDSGIFYPHFYPGKGVGEAQMVIDIFNIHNRDQKVTIVVYATAWDAYNGISILNRNSEFNIVPNPTNLENSFIIKGSNKGLLTIRNIEGKTLLKKNITTQNSEINTNSLSQGVYIVELNDGQQIKTQKLIIN